MRGPLCAAVVSLCLAQAAVPQTAPKLIELSKTDLFTIKVWNSTQISVMGLHLGMTRQDAIVEARRHRWQFINNSPPYLPGDCTVDKHCFVVDSADVNHGISFELDSKDQIIFLSLRPVFPNPGPKDGILGSFQGDTYRLFQKYTDELRMKLLGPADESKSIREALSTETTHYYWKLGLTLHVHPLPGAPSIIEVVAELYPPRP